MTARISIRDEPSISLPPREDVERLLALTNPPSSPLTPLSSPLPQIPSLPLLVPPPVPVLPLLPPASHVRPLGYRAAMIWLRVETPSTSHPLALPTSSPPLQLLSSDRRADRLEITLPPRKRLGIDLGPRCEVGKSSATAAARPTRGRRADYMFVDPREAVEEVAPMTLKGVNTRVTELTTIQEQDTQDIYAVIGDTQDRQTQIYQRVETLVDDSQYHYETARLLDQRLTVSREAWGRSLEKMAPKRTARARPAPETTTTTTSVTNAQLQAMIDQGVTAALAARDATRNGDDSHTSGTGVRRTKRVARECTYQDFMKCQPLYFKGTKGVVELTQWFERMEIVFRISNCFVDNQIKFSTYTLLAGALTWWNSHVRIVGQDVVYAMTWIDLRKKMTDKYCSRNEMKKLEVKMFPEESDKVERYVGGLPDMIQGSVVASKPKTMQEATKMASELMDKKINTIAERQNTGKAYTAGSGDKKQYGGSKPLCPKYNYNHNGPCAPKCYKCNKFGHLGRNCRSPVSVNPGSNQRGNRTGQGPTCLECGVRGHFKTDSLKLKNNNNNHGNQVRNANAPAKVYAVGHDGTNPDSNVVTGTVLLNNCYASILFNTGADRSFVSTAFSSQIDITPSTLDHYYDVELADGRIIGLNYS
ncbi:putative reverse transcriptase domain-containing protein [Tanacetum coccineum]